MIGLVAAVTIATAAQAQQIKPMPYRIMCGPVALFEKNVAEKHGEAVVGRGVAHNGNTLVEVWSAESGSYTVTLRKADNSIICVLIAGEGWEAAAPKRGVSH